MRIVGHLNAGLALLLTICAAPAAAQDLFTLTIYLASEQALCPGGYGQSDKCAIFTASKFEELLRRRRLRQIDKFSNVAATRTSSGSAAATIPLGQEALSFARRCDSASPATVLLVVDWPQREQTGLLNESHPLFKSMNRRSFNYGSVCRLDPESDYVWHFSTKNAHLTIAFR